MKCACFLPILALTLLCALDASAFAGYVAPARFELKGQPGQVIRQVLDIGNDAPTADEFSLRTADWLLTRSGGVEFEAEQLAAGSCRPWVQIERFTIKLAARAKRRFRFEVQIPADAKAQECRFALLIEQATASVPIITASGLQFPLTGRIGVIVYVQVGEVSPKLEIRTIRLDRVNGVVTPVVDVENTGSATGRLEGTLEGTDATSTRIDFSISSFPILPGEKRTIVVSPHDAPDGKKPPWKPPLKLKGDLEWAGGKYPVDLDLKLK